MVETVRLCYDERTPFQRKAVAAAQITDVDELPLIVRYMADSYPEDPPPLWFLGRQPQVGPA